MTRYRILQDDRGFVAQKLVTEKIWRYRLLAFVCCKKVRKWRTMDVLGRACYQFVNTKYAPVAIFPTIQDAQDFIGKLIIGR
jgi:hypothetical protein